MRNIAIILSLLIFNMVIVPCADVPTCEEENNIELTDSQDHSNNQTDDCTPLCLCSCCGVLYALSGVHLQAQNIYPSVDPYSTIYVDAKTRGIIKSVWRPPSIC